MRWPATEHLVEKGAQAPPVRSLAVADTLDYLGRQILGCATVRVRSRPCFIRLEPLLRQAKVGDLDVALVVQQHILWLQIPVNYAVRVQASERLNKLRSVKAGPTLAELLVLSQVVKKLAAIEKIHHEVQLGGCLERIVQLDNERTVDLLQDIPLSYDRKRWTRIVVINQLTGESN